MNTIIQAIGLVLIVEGLVFALAPSRLEDLLDAMKEMSIDTRRFCGLIALALGVGLIWITRF